MNSEEDEFRRIEREALRRAAREALAQPEQEPVAWNVIDPTGNILATEKNAIRGWARVNGYKLTVEGLLGLHELGWRVLPTSPPATKPEQEPSEWRDMIVVSLVREGIDKHLARELADHFAAQRPWQGLTDAEIWSAVSRIGTADSNVNPLIILSDARAIEAKLKGKNHDTART